MPMALPAGASRERVPLARIPARSCVRRCHGPRRRPPVLASTGAAECRRGRRRHTEEPSRWLPSLRDLVLMAVRLMSRRSAGPAAAAGGRGQARRHVAQETALSL